MARWRTTHVVLTVALAFVTLSADILSGQDRRPGGQRRVVALDGREVVDGEVLVRYRAGTGQVERARAELDAGVAASEAVGRRGGRRLRSERMTTRQMLRALRANPDVELVEPNYVIRANAMPNDPRFGSLWGLFNTGQTVEGQAGMAGADIGATAAWDVTTGSRNIVVAILDSGIDAAHPDLAANVFTAPRAFSVALGSGTVSCPAGSHGFNALTNTCVTTDDNGHGTHVAGIIGAVGNNGVGVTGVAWTTSLMALKVLGADGTGTTADAAEAIDFAIKARAALGADANIRILNISWGGADYSQFVAGEIEQANTADMLVVASAGTDSSSNDITPHYPASYASANVISVAAADNRGALAPFSNYGATTVDLAAPGMSTVSTLPGNTYGNLSGTSMSSAFVSGAAALVMTACPSQVARVKATLMATVDPETSMASTTVSGGRLNVGNALAECVASLHATISGTTVTATVENGPGNTDDWVALFCPATSADTTYVDWKYLNNTTTAPGTGLADATVTLRAPAQGGTSCNARLFSNNPRFKLATSGDVTVTVIPPSLDVTPTNVAPGGALSASLAQGPGNPSEWVGLFATGAANSQYTQWKYLNGQQTPPSTGLSSATLSFTAPTTPGNYELRWFSNTGSTLATSATISVGSTTPSAPVLTVGDISVTEGNSGTVTATFTVTLSPVHASQTVTVNYATADGTATTANNDYVAASGTLSFPPSTSTRTVTVTVNGDAVQESAETFSLALSGAVNATIGDAQAIATITNDDTPSGPAVTLGASSVAPGGTINFTVSGGPANRTDWVALSTTSAPDGGHIKWIYLSGTTTAPATGVSGASLQFTVPATPGSYNIRFYANDGMQKLATSATLTVGAAPSPTLTIGDVSVTEGNAGTSVATFTVTLSPVNSSQTVTVDYATANGSATAGSDYTAGSGTLSFSPSAATRTIAVVIQGDTTQESSETFMVNLSGATNATIGDAQATGTIANDDGAAVPAGPAVTINTPNVSPGGTISFSVSGGPANVRDWVSIGLQSSADTGYVNWIYLSGTRTAPASGMANATLQFTAPATPGTYDIRFFSNDTFTRLARSGPITVSSAPPSPALTIADVSVTEGASGTSVATFTVRVSPVNSTQSVTVDYSTANGTATAGSDYVANSGTLTFAPGVTTQTIGVAVNGDTTLESTETFTVTLANAVNATIGDAQAVGTIVNDEVPPGPSVNVTTTSVAPGGIIQFTISGGPANVRDWVALSPTSAADGGHVKWMYLNGQNYPPAGGTGSATLQFTAPAAPGTYHIRFYANDTYTRLATSATITVAP